LLFAGQMIIAKCQKFTPFQNCNANINMKFSIFSLPQSAALLHSKAK